LEDDMDGWMEYRIKQELFQAEAARRRLLAEAEHGRRKETALYDRLLAAIGRQLSDWGERLQAREPQRAHRREALA